MRLFFVRVDGRMVARSWIRCELQENLGSALLHVDVLEDFTGRGIGRALLEHAEALAAADGRTILQTFTEHPADFDADGPDVLKPATGTGALPAGARGRPVRRDRPATGWSRWSGSAPSTCRRPRHAGRPGTGGAGQGGGRTSCCTGPTAARRNMPSSSPC